MASDYTVPVKGGGKIELEKGFITALPDHVYKAVIIAGMKDLLNRGMTKIGPLKVDATKGHDEATVAATAVAAMAVAEKNLANLKDGKLPRMAGVKAPKTGVSGEVMTEARRLARLLIKDEIKATGAKISHYSAKDISEAANAYLAGDDGPAMIAKAQANVDARGEAVASKPTPTIAELEARLGISVSATKVAAAEKEKAKKAEQKAAGGNVLSAAKAGTLKTRSKGAPAGATVN